MKKTKLLYVIPAVCCLLTGCGAGSEAVHMGESMPIETMFQSAYEKIENKNFEAAAGIFTEIESMYPTSLWAADALIMAAYSQYEAMNFAEALTNIDRFMRFHPGHKRVDYILYLRGMCFYRQVSDVRREPGMSSHALNIFAQLVQRFPESEYAKNAENKILILKNYIAGKVMFSARRDLARQNYTVAITNLQRVVRDMQETQMTAEAMYRLTEAYTAIGLVEQADGFAKMLRLNFPDSAWAKKLKT